MNIAAWNSHAMLKKKATAVIATEIATKDWNHRLRVVAGHGNRLS
jgi:hypothetical protein